MVLSSDERGFSQQDWNNQCGDIFGMPGGVGLCCYVLVCPLCAAGDTALAANEDCCCACCIAPTLCIFPCYWAHLRQAQARKYSISDPLSTGPLGALLPCLMFTFGCHLCLLTQQLNHAKAVQLSGGLQGLAPHYPTQRVMH